ncbi:alanine racemase [Novosphingobium sp. PC22D]|uniref:alanine racemase n=1 Tax=Novosphingobium sp. PC22D TaxID=1962403 RepID=UPI000BF037BA|nr:alanine racemase [Novosphingobium sp. PC22D]PEQ11233.1 alanine racemase [Novosphingobium sp. PC22D]
MPPDPPPAALRLEIDGDALAANWRGLDALSGEARAGAAVKANAYGLGARRVVERLANEGCRDFFVAHWGEAGDLLGVVEPASIAVLHGPMTDRDCAYARATGVRPVINSLAQARRWTAAGGGACDLMIDTGMNRLGLAASEIGDEAVGALDIEVLHSHLASADEDVPLNDLQQRRWAQARVHVPHRRAALANSAGIVLGERFHGELTRPGIALYGGVPCVALSGAIRQVARPAAAVIQVREIEAGEGVGYNTVFVAPRAMRIGTIAVGYADGYLRCWSNRGEMRSRDGTVPVIGRVSMDMTIVDLSDAPTVGEGDWLEIAYNLPRAAASSGLSQYELLTLLGSRFAR